MLLPSDSAPGSPSSSDPEVGAATALAAADAAAAVLSALPLLVLDRDTRRTFALYAGARAAQTGWRMAREAGWLRGIGVMPVGGSGGKTDVELAAGSNTGGSGVKTEHGGAEGGKESLLPDEARSKDIDGTGPSTSSADGGSSAGKTDAKSSRRGGRGGGGARPPHWIESTGETLLLAASTSLIMHAFVLRPGALQGGLRRFMMQVQPIDRAPMEAIARHARGLDIDPHALNEFVREAEPRFPDV